MFVKFEVEKEGGFKMKRILAYTFCSLSILFIVSGCTAEKQSSDEKTVNSGSLNENYVGDANVVLEEEYKQTPAEAKAQEELVKSLEGDSFSGGGLSGH